MYLTGKWETKAQVICMLIVHMEVCCLSVSPFVDEETNINFPFAIRRNGLNGLNGLHGLAHLCF